MKLSKQGKDNIRNATTTILERSRDRLGKTWLLTPEERIVLAEIGRELDRRGES